MSDEFFDQIFRFFHSGFFGDNFIFIAILKAVFTDIPLSADMFPKSRDGDKPMSLAKD
jgi:hypothetical protein